ncbi:MAG: hypothetical protein JKY32_10640 [Rhizobiales bacterium]|nr:hypothetical protein [Hyphomicrobiales bacterium]
MNTYRPPNLGAADGGDADGGITLIEQLVPDARERAWFRQWLAYKWKHPHVPGPAVIMVARDMGTGRGTFAYFLKLLFGNRYVVNVPFKIFAGLNTQSQFTEWGLNALFAIVNESSATGDMSTYKTKHAVYEHLKEMVEPRPTERNYVIKGEGSVNAVSSMTSMVMTNHSDAIPLPEGDRRFAVLTNGCVRDPEFWNYINEWLGKKANIAAFSQWLEATDLASYDPYAVPLSTVAKEEMSELNKSPLDRLLHDAMAEMDGYFVPEQVLHKMAEAEMRTKSNLPHGWRNIATKEISQVAYACRNNSGRKIETQINGRRCNPMHTDRKMAEKCIVRTEAIRSEVIKNGDVFGLTPAASKIKPRLKIVKKD